MSIESMQTGYDYFYTLPFGSSAYVQVTLPPGANSQVSVSLPEGTSILPVESSNDNVKVTTTVEENNTTLIHAIDTDSSNIVPATLNLVLYTLPDALGGQVMFNSPTAPTIIRLEEKFSEDDYDASWSDEGSDPDVVGSVSFDAADLDVLWGDVPYAFKQKFPSDGPFGGVDSYGEDGYLKNVSVYLGGEGVLDQDMATPFDEEDSRYGEHVPEVVYFGIYLVGRQVGYGVYLALAHTMLPNGFTSGDTIVGATTRTKMIIIPAESTLVALSEYNDFLGGGITNAYIVGPSGLNADGDFDPVVFENTPSASTWIDCTDNSFWTASSGYWNASGEYWNDSPADMRLTPKYGATWHLGFRPTKVRVTCDVGSPPLRVSVGTYTAGYEFGNEDNYISGTELDLVCTEDIGRINIYASGYTSGTQVHKIEFLV